MKRTLIILISILIGVFILLSVLGAREEYSAERAIYRANKKFASIKDDPLAAPEARYKEVIEDYKKFLKKYPHSRLAPFAHILIGRTYVLKKDYEMARSTFERVVQQYDDMPNIAAQGLLEIAAVHSEQRDLDGVIKTYERLKNAFPLSEQGLQAPLTLARIIFSENRPGASEAFNNAIKYYRQLIVEHGHSPIGFKALHLIAGCQLAQQHWKEAVNVYAEILLSYPEPEYISQYVGQLLLRSINTLSVTRLNDYDLPIGIYGQFIEKYPQHPLNPILKQIIDGLKELKQQQMQSQPVMTQQQ